MRPHRAPARPRSPGIVPWHKPESAESSAIRSVPGDNRTFSNPGSTLQQRNTPAAHPIRSALQQLHHIGLLTAEAEPCLSPKSLRSSPLRGLRSVPRRWLKTLVSVAATDRSIVSSA